MNGDMYLKTELNYQQEKQCNIYISNVIHLRPGGFWFCLFVNI